MPYKKEKVCFSCKKNFLARMYNAKYCEECKNILYKSKYNEELKCKNCGATFKKKIIFHAFCSQKCQQGFRKKGLNATLAIKREFFLEKYYFTCQKCNLQFNSNNLDVHHKIPLYKGGEDLEENITVLCIGCHRIEHKVY